jgi:hypothetical protein
MMISHKRADIADTVVSIADIADAVSIAGIAAAYCSGD